MATYIEPYMFNIVLNSQQASTTFSSGNNNDLTYLFNWSNIPQGRYQVSFCYRGLNNADLVADDSPQVFVSFNSNSSTYQASGVDGSNVSLYLGTLRIETHAALQAYFYANQYDNPDVFLIGKPMDNQIRVQVFRSDFVTPFTTVSGALALANYVLVLSFKKIGK